MANVFRNPARTVLRSPTFGLPRGTFGRGIFSPDAIILHVLRCTLEAYDAQEVNGFTRDAAEPLHPSLHYALDAGGNIHQYVEDADIAWGLWDYSMGAFPAPFPEGAWGMLSENPGVTPDRYSLHIGIASGLVEGQIEHRTLVPITSPLLASLARLVAWLCHTYSIPCDAEHVTTHDAIDAQVAGLCVPADFPYSTVLALAAGIVDAGGESPDNLFDAFRDWQEFQGPFTVGVSRVSSAAYISPG